VLTVDGTARLGEINVPTLILWGERDAFLECEEQERRAAAIPYVTLRVYPDPGHAVAWERPEWVVRDLEEFVKDARPFSPLSQTPARTFENSNFHEVG
jgi:pimeloyl-ACP methyl ester carboxylesterase